MSEAPAQRVSTWLAAMPVVFVLIWSTGFVVARFGMPHAPPMSFLALRYGLSVLAFAVWVALARAAWPSGAAQWAHLAVTGVLMHAGYLGGVWAAVKLGMGAGTVALIVGLQPLLTAVWLSTRGTHAPAGPSRGRMPASHAREPVSARQWLGLLLGFGGLALVVGHQVGVGEVSAFSFGLAVLALFCITSGTLYQKRFVASCDVRTANLVQLVAALLVTAPLALLEREAVRWTGEMLGALAWSVLVLTLGGSSLLYMLIQRGAATRVTSLMYLVPPCTAVLAWLLFGESLTGWSLAGIALTVLGVALVARATKLV